MGISRRIAAAAALALLAGCGDLFAPPAGAGLALDVRAGAPAPQQAPSFDEVDGMNVRVTRGDEVVVDGSFAVFPVEGEIRRTFVVPMESDEELLYLDVILRSGGTAVYAGGDTVRLVRGRRTVAQVVLLPVSGAASRAPAP
jgi:hypothetical protein